MLVLSRNTGGEVIIDLAGLVETAVEAAGPYGRMVREAMLDSLGDEPRMIVTLVALPQPGRARLGFEVPRCLPVHRREIWDANQQREGSKP